MRAACALLILVACTAESEDLSVGEQLGQNLNGQNLNGQNLNGQNLNGSTLGTSVLWTSLQGVKLGGSTLLEAAWLEGTELVGKNGSSIHRGLDFHQAEFQAQSNTGVALRLRVRQVDTPAAAGGPWRYWVEYSETDGKWYPICLDGTAAQPAIAIDGWWNPQAGVPGGGGKVTDSTKLTFACPKVGAIGKCLDIGYRAWVHASHHQACVRAIRADYCGDGVTYTTDGKIINLYDALGIQVDTEDWRIEAEWDAAGARCFSQNNRALDHVPCFKDRATSSCGKLTNFSKGTLLMTEMP